MEWTSHLGFLCKIAFFFIHVMYSTRISSKHMTWCSSKYFSVDSRFYFGNPLPGEASPKLPRPFLIWEVWTVTFSQKLPVALEKWWQKIPYQAVLAGISSCFGLFWLSWARRKSIDFGKTMKNYHQWNSSTTLQPTSYNICCTWIGPKALRCWYFPPMQHREE